MKNHNPIEILDSVIVDEKVVAVNENESKDLLSFKETALNGNPLEFNVKSKENNFYKNQLKEEE